LKDSFSDVDGEKPTIPDHEMLRVIGKGSYGHVWLARSVTGALRAVKVVKRSNFEYDRKFEGIRKYEPISRDHPGLVAILHVGRNLMEGFYYYVMELADDRLTGSEIHAELYIPRTLSTDVKKAGRLKIDDCLVAGATMADALHHMHSCGLSHRDVKPSNVIFVDGIAKLADIGLVAASGQRTFVGTEGFVPPEGPGSPQADIYSLGMVLYEISTGKDRMEFPEVPGNFTDESERKKWRQLNQVICKACAPSPKQRFSTAREMRLSLDRVKSLRFGKMPIWQRMLSIILISGILALAITLGRNGPILKVFDQTKQIVDRDVMEARLANNPPPVQPIQVIDPVPPVVEPVVEPVPEVPTTASVKVLSVPPGAKVSVNGELWGITPMTRTGVSPGEIEFVLELEGYKTVKFREMIVASDRLLTVGGQTLTVWNPPLAGDIWENSLGMKFRFVKGRHVSTRAVSEAEFEKYMADVERNFQMHTAKIASDNPLIETEETVVMVSRKVAMEYCSWLTQRERAKGYLTSLQAYELNDDVDYDLQNIVFSSTGEVNNEIAIFCAVSQASQGSLELISVPPGASVYLDEEYQGVTPLSLPLEPGLARFFLKAPGYKRKMVEILIKADQPESTTVELEPSNEVTFGKPWENGLGMRFVPLGTQLIGVWEVRVKDFDAYIEDENIVKYHKAPFGQGPDHPVVNVSAEDAQAYCQWLTRHDRELELIGPNDVYRLPTDLEWSEAAGLSGERGQTPSERDSLVRGKFTWGEGWPPPQESGNFADRSAIGSLGRQKILTEYEDGFIFTAPVGRFSATATGIHDLAGNVWEWVSDKYGGGAAAADWAVARGGCYSTFEEDNLMISYRYPLDGSYRGVLYGFRCMLVREEIEN
jgi:formylglycine-generating enzyme required for sulfatase activity